MTQQNDLRRYSIRAIDRAVQVLQCFSLSQRELALVEIAEQTGISISTVYRILQTLQQQRLVVLNSTSNKYSLGIRLFELGGLVSFPLNFRILAAPFLDFLSMKKERTVLAAILDEGELLYIDKRERKDSVRFSSEIGKRRAPHFGMLGKTLMAYLPEMEVDELLERYPLTKIASNSVTDQRIFKKHLAEIRANGYTLEHGESVEGMIGIAAPIRNHIGAVVVAVGVTFPAFRANEKIVEETISTIKETMLNISIELSRPADGRTK